MNRRDFLSGRFGRDRKKSAPSSDFNQPGCNPSVSSLSGCDDAGCDWRHMLPPEFSPAMLRAQARALGLDPDAMSEEEIAMSVIEAMNAQRPGQAGAS